MQRFSKRPSSRISLFIGPGTDRLELSFSSGCGRLLLAGSTGKKFPSERSELGRVGAGMWWPGWHQTTTLPQRDEHG